MLAGKGDEHPRSSSFRRSRPAGLTARASAVLGSPAGIAVPIQRHPPKVIVFACLAEFACFAGFVWTGSFVTFAMVITASVALLALAATNTRQILVVTGTGLEVLAASARGRPIAPLGAAPRHTTLPDPSGVGVPLVLGERTWWVDRSSFDRLRRAQELVRRL